MTKLVVLTDQPLVRIGKRLFCDPLLYERLTEIVGEDERLRSQGQPGYTLDQMARMTDERPGDIKPLLSAIRHDQRRIREHLERRSEWVNEEVHRAFSAPGPGAHDDKRRASGLVDWDQVHGHVDPAEIAREAREAIEAHEAREAIENSDC